MTKLELIVVGRACFLDYGRKLHKDFGTVWVGGTFGGEIRTDFLDRCAVLGSSWVVVQANRLKPIYILFLFCQLVSGEE